MRNSATWSAPLWSHERPARRRAGRPGDLTATWPGRRSQNACRAPFPAGTVLQSDPGFPSRLPAGSQMSAPLPPTARPSFQGDRWRIARPLQAPDHRLDRGDRGAARRRRAGPPDPPPAAARPGGGRLRPRLLLGHHPGDPATVAVAVGQHSSLGRPSQRPAACPGARPRLAAALAHAAACSTRLDHRALRQRRRNQQRQHRRGKPGRQRLHPLPAGPHRGGRHAGVGDPARPRLVHLAGLGPPGSRTTSSPAGRRSR